MEYHQLKGCEDEEENFSVPSSSQEREVDGIACTVEFANGGITTTTGMNTSIHSYYKYTSERKKFF